MSRAALGLLLFLCAGSAEAGALSSLAASPSSWLPKADLHPKGPHPHGAAVPPLGPEETRCELCHTVSSWSEATFAHERTGFPLEGAHKTTACKSCHKVDFKSPIPQRCDGCHRDPHHGDFGQRCEGCHTEDTWKALFTPDAHRRTNFPLVGRHALIPCTECHTEMADRRFVRTTVDCLSCHEADFDRTVGTAVNHFTLGFGTRCRDCHSAFRFQGAHFAEHDRCFEVTSGPHAAVACLSCHTTLAGVQLSGTCSTDTASCTGCHEHLCSRTDPIHAQVPGYQCKDRKCYECHRFSSGP